MKLGDLARWTGIWGVTALLGLLGASACEDSDHGAARDEEAENARSGSTGSSRPSRHDDDYDDDDYDDDYDAADAGSYRRDAGHEAPSSPTSMSVKFTIPFHAVIAGEAFHCGRSYSDVGTNKSEVTPQDLRLFVQDVQLLRKDGSAVDLELEVREPWQSSKVALLDFENASGDCSAGTSATNTKITGSAPEGDYVGIRFSNGVPEELNHLDPSTQPPPLSTSAALAWSWTQGFRFAKIELRQAATASQSYGSALFHVGSTACTGSAGKVSCSKPNRNLITLEPFDPDLDTVRVDLAPLFESTDLTQTVECHATGSECQTMFDAFGLDLSTGKPAKSQAIYSVE